MPIEHFNPDTGVKSTFDSGAQRVEVQPPYAQIPPCALRRLAMIFAEDEVKYGRDNWKKGSGLPWYSLYNHLMDHLQKYHEGDRSEDHLANIMWGAMAQIYYDEQAAAQQNFDQAMKNALESKEARTSRALYEMPLTSQKPQQSETREQRTDRQTTEIMGTSHISSDVMARASAQDLEAVSDFHDPTLSAQRGKDTARLQYEYNIQMAAARLEYGQGRYALEKAVDDLIIYEQTRAKQVDPRK